VTAPGLLDALLPVLGALDRLGIPHYVGGSLASSAHGVPRASIDADVVAWLTPERAESFIAAMSGAYYLSEERVRDAIRRRASCNLIHLDTMIKIDLFVAKDRPFERRALERRETIEVSDQPPATLPVASAEDIVLAKLEWYRAGGESSSRQWEDVLGVLRMNPGEALDLDYLRGGAAELEVEDLLSRALEEASRAP
jgi:hypothetical protein